MLDDIATFRRPGTNSAGFDRIAISIADPDIIRNEWSHGEVKKPETINHRSFKPERDGLFCAKIFGPVKDYECLCGRYKRMKYRGVVCEKCDVEVTLKKVRRERMGHIDLAAPVTHVWFLKSNSASIGLMLGMKFEDLKKIVYFEAHVVIDPGLTNLRPRQLLTDEQYEKVRDEHKNDEFHAGTGAEAIYELLKNLNGGNLQQEAEALRVKVTAMKQELRTRKFLEQAGRVLDIKYRDLVKLLNWQNALVLHSGSAARLKAGTLFTESRLANVGARYAAQGAIFASGPSALRDYFSICIAEGKLKDGELRDELLSVLKPQFEIEAQLLAEDGSTDEGIEVIAQDELLAGILDLQPDALEAILTGQFGLQATEKDGEVSREVVTVAKASGAYETGLGAVARLLSGLKLAKKMRTAVAEWQTSRINRILRLAEGSETRAPDRELSEKELKTVLEDTNKRRRFLNKFLESGNRPEWMVLTVLPVLPPELRPLVQLDGGRFATSDLNELYRRVINRNNRLRKLNDQQAPDIIIRNEKRMLQRSVDALLANGSIGEPSLDSNKRALKSFSDVLFGKQGRFRQNLLGKRVDFSGRSVIVVGPNLKLHQCGLPKLMALELFKPFIFSKLQQKGHSKAIKESRILVEQQTPEVWDALAEVIREHPVLLNRAPTLHRLGIQAFEPMLIEGKAIQLHPLVCAAFNADFDGDQMAVHVPLSIEAQLEARVLMMSTNNILSPADGKPVIIPSQDMVLGLYYQSLLLDGEPGEGMSFAGPAELEHAAYEEIISLHSKVNVRMETFDEEGKPVVRRVKTSLGRVRLAVLLPKHPELPFDRVNQVLRTSDVRQLIDAVYRHCGQKETVIFCDQIMQLGFTAACRAGISVGMNDMIIPREKQQLVKDTQARVDDLEEQFRSQLIPAADRYNRVVDAWTKCTDEIADAVIRETEVPIRDDATGRLQPNSVYMMMHSGARGSKDQMKQIAGMRGLMSKPSGEIIDKPILANFMEGLPVREYFYSTHGARKGQTDTALKTARSGYLTRRLVYLAHGCVVTDHDCGTKQGINIDAVVPSERHPVSFSNRLLGRVSQETVKDSSDNVLIKAGHMIEESQAARIEESGLAKVRVRSTLTCETEDGVCAQCYGRDLARGELVTLGETVGIIAAQSIGEPGTQLTMRTFHSGGVAAMSERQTLDAPVAGTFEVRDAKVVVDADQRTRVIGRNAKVAILGEQGHEFAVEGLPNGARITAKILNKKAQSGTVEVGERLAEWDPYNHLVIAVTAGTVKYQDLLRSVTYREEEDEATGSKRRTVIDWMGSNASQSGSGAPEGNKAERPSAMKPSLAVADEAGNPVKMGPGVYASHLLSPGAMILVDEGEKVEAGHVLARSPRFSATSVDITGGLPRLEGLFNVHSSEKSSRAIIARTDGHVRFGPVRGNNRRLFIEPLDRSEEPIEYSVLKSRHIAVTEGTLVRRGEYLIDGDPAPQDILDVHGEEEGPHRLARYLIDESHKVYRAQGVEINDKHIEVIVRQMLRKVKILDPGETNLLEDARIDRTQLVRINAKAEAEGLRPALGQPIVRRYFDELRRDTSSFIAEASFVETQRVLTRAAAEGEVDELLGLKENVMTGRLIPAGTGLVSRAIRNSAIHRDAEIKSQKMLERKATAERLEADRTAKAQANFYFDGEGKAEEAIAAEAARRHRPDTDAARWREKLNFSILMRLFASRGA